MAAKKLKGIKKKDHENLSDSNVQHVLNLMEAEKPITKKEACAILNISYNTTRLQTILDNYLYRKDVEKRNRDKKRGKPASDDEIKSIVKEYLEGESVSEIAKGLFRSTTFVKSIIARLGVPEKLTGDAKFSTAVLPDQCVKDEFEIGEIVWSAKYHAPCEVKCEVESDSVDYRAKYGCPVYRVYVMQAIDPNLDIYPPVQSGGFSAYSPAYDLGSLKHLGGFNV